MPEANIKVTFAQASVEIEDLTLIGGEKYLHSTIEMIFPSGHILLMKKYMVVQPHDVSGNQGNYYSDVLLSPDENIISGRKIVLSTDSIKEDLPFAPNSYTKDGEQVSFNHNVFPSGVYKINYTLLTSTRQYQISLYVMNTVVVDYCIREFSDKIIAVKCDNTECNDKIKSTIQKIYEMIVLKEGAKLSYAAGEYVKASLKLRAAERICNNGPCCCQQECDD